METGGGLPSDIDAVTFDPDGGPEQARALVEGWKREDWPGLLDPENERLLRWAQLHELAGPAVADALFSFEVDEGNEPLLEQRVLQAFLCLRAVERQRTRARKVKP